MRSRIFCIAVALAAFLGAAPAAFVKPRNSSHRGTSHHATKARTSKTPAVRTPKKAKTSAAAVARNEHGRIQRSAAARHAFARQTGYPNGRPGYVVDHIRPLACGGADNPANMQWQTIAAAKAKDKVERI